MFDLVEWKKTKFYQEANQEGKQEAIPVLLKLGLTPEQIAQELDLDLELVNHYIASQSQARD